MCVILAVLNETLFSSLCYNVMKVERVQEQMPEKKRRIVKKLATFSFENYLVYGCVDVNGVIFFKNKKKKYRFWSFT